MLFNVILAVAILFLVYVLVIRPVLAGVPALKSFFTEADTVYGKVAALAWRSATVAWSYVLLIVGAIANQIDTIAGLLGDPDFKTQVTSLIGANPQVLSWFLLIAAVITFAARMRSITKG